MSLLPALLNELIEDLNNLNRPTRYLLGDLYDQHFGLGLGDIPSTRLPHLPAIRAGYLRPWRNLAPPESGISTVKVDESQFKVSLDVSHFKPEELNVHVDGNGYVVIDGKHEERSDEHGLISRQFTRKYKLPETVDLDTLASSLSTDGVLTIAAAKKTAADAQGRAIKIVQTNQPALQTQTSTAEKKVEIVKENSNMTEESSTASSAE
uniref:21.9 kDa heat shock protein n=1 Tax=Lygus hesperus TaxID=30085 RepID=K9MU82_LYGHE|nr:21.9 kDa heat shock protein [Lygus hesperus]